MWSEESIPSLAERVPAFLSARGGHQRVEVLRLRKARLGRKERCPSKASHAGCCGGPMRARRSCGRPGRQERRWRGICHLCLWGRFPRPCRMESILHADTACQIVAREDTACEAVVLPARSAQDLHPGTPSSTTSQACWEIRFSNSDRPASKRACRAWRFPRNRQSGSAQAVPALRTPRLMSSKVVAAFNSMEYGPAPVQICSYRLPRTPKTPRAGLSWRRRSLFVPEHADCGAPLPDRPQSYPVRRRAQPLPMPFSMHTAVASAFSSTTSGLSPLAARWRIP